MVPNAQCLPNSCLKVSVTSSRPLKYDLHSSVSLSLWLPFNSSKTSSLAASMSDINSCAYIKQNQKYFNRRNWFTMNSFPSAMTCLVFVTVSGIFTTWWRFLIAVLSWEYLLLKHASKVWQCFTIFMFSAILGDDIPIFGRDNSCL